MFTVKSVELSKLKKPFCQVCGRWHRISKKEDSVDNLVEIWLEDGAIPVIRLCGDCKEQLKELI